MCIRQMHTEKVVSGKWMPRGGFKKAEVLKLTDIG